MDQELISKKELLELTGISYGQLYRWKRKNLIPEDWFVRKSTFTGQETFFPKTQILARIDKIKNMKDDLSLDELADVFSPVGTDLSMGRQELLERNIVSKSSMELFARTFGNGPVYPFTRILYAYLLDKLLRAGDINLDEGAMMLQTIKDHEAKFENKNWELVFIRKMGISSFLMIVSPGEYAIEAGSKIVVRLNAAAVIEELKLKLS
ncbi:YhbD family protein [Paenibacillus flagellatus]|uniref:DUF4004 domain-containing protein n=1 Tax=Paenibacillus flagellatus TaxID=2211139 RepID=A0A2V5K6X4_9BACL|nr:YhbD family protein [Paenibacillus flagellatus]PYI55161.1 DUF4004 domain-containing protein [Paenibacillus flagellatus]